MNVPRSNEAVLFLAGVVCGATALWFFLPDTSRTRFRKRLVSKKSSSTPAPSASSSSAVKAASKVQKVRGSHDGEHARFVHERVSAEEAHESANSFFELMNQRRTLRFFSDEPVPLALVQKCVQAAATAPSGAHQQPWTFVIVQDQEVKRQIRAAVEAEEQLNYDKRMSREWVAELEGMMSSLHHNDEIAKPYLTEAPYLVLVMKQSHSYFDDEQKEKRVHYYPKESCGIAAGMLITALHVANLVTLTSTPMGAEQKIRELTGRPSNEKVFLLMPVGYPAKDAMVPYRVGDELRKPMHEVCKVV